MADFYAGYISGALGILLGSPLDILKVHLQSRSTSTTTTSPSSSISLFPTATSYIRGTAAPLLGYGCLNAILFYTYNRTLSLLSTPQQQQQQQQQSSLATIWTAGAVGGAISFVLSAPVELVKVRTQTRPDENSYKVARGVVKREGVRGLYLGGGVTGVRDSVGYGFYFWAYEYMKRLLRYKEAVGEGGGGEDQDMAGMKILLAGGVAGCISWLSVYPLDVIKTRVQTQDECEGLLGNKRLGTWECAKSAYAGGGARVFFNGLGICMARAFLVCPPPPTGNMMVVMGFDE
ncbi:mitochondrial carrier domain-containing protein [Tuber brumale]|nr:mitochondrial carrier domain-containing protein [Tuber brumale]